MNCPFCVADSSDCSFSSHVATEENIQEAIRLFTVSTMDAARSGVNQQINLTPDMANEIKVCRLNVLHHALLLPRLSFQVLMMMQ